MDLSEKLITLRKRNGMSQEELAIKLNISRQAVHKWENAISRPDIENLMELSKIFGVSVDTLLNDSKPLPQVNGAQSAGFEQNHVGKEISSESMVGRLDGYQLFPHYKKSERKVKIISLAIGILLPVILYILTITLPSGSDTAFTLLSMYILFMAIAYVVKFFVVRKMLKKIHMNLSIDLLQYIENKTAEAEKDVLKKGYEVCMQTSEDVLRWLFYDSGRDVLGLYYDGCEQLVIPLSNYVDITFNTEEYFIGTPITTVSSIVYLENGSMCEYRAALDASEEETANFKNFKTLIDYKKMSVIEK